MKNVLFLIHDLGGGGAEKVLVNLVNNLDKTKYNITLQTLFDVGVNRDYLNDDINYIPGWKYMFHGNVTLMKLFNPKLLAKMVIKDDYDIVVSFLEGPCNRIVSAYNGKKIAWIHIEHDSKKNISLSFRNEKEMINCYSNFNKIICVAKTVKNNFLSLTNLNTDCEVLYNVNETNIIVEKSNYAQNIIVKDSGWVNIISVGRLIINHKGFDRLLRIHKKLLDNGINNRLYILGEGHDENKLKQMIDELNINDTCKLLGYDENPYKYVVASDLFVCSSIREGFSTATTEALVLGVPVVSTEVSGAREMLGDNEYGLVTDNNETALYDGVYKMLTEENLLEYYKKQAMVRGKKFSTEETVKAVDNMLDSI